MAAIGTRGLFLGSMKSCYNSCLSGSPPAASRLQGPQDHRSRAIPWFSRPFREHCSGRDRHRKTDKEAEERGLWPLACEVLRRTRLVNLLCPQQARRPGGLECGCTWSGCHAGLCRAGEEAEGPWVQEAKCEVATGTSRAGSRHSPKAIMLAEAQVVPRKLHAGPAPGFLVRSGAGMGDPSLLEGASQLFSTGCFLNT